MELARRPLDTEEDPHLSTNPEVWGALVEAIGPASLLVAIASRMSDALRGRYAPEDVLQESLLHAWRDRNTFTWRGVAGFRRWILQIAENRIRALVVRDAASKRGGGQGTKLFSDIQHDSAGSAGETEADLAIISTTPSRVAGHKQEAEAMRAALESLPPDVREVVRLRLFDEVTMEEIAARLDIGLSAAKHRFRAGAAIYRERLRAILGDRSDLQPGPRKNS